MEVNDRDKVSILLNAIRKMSSLAMSGEVSDDAEEGIRAFCAGIAAIGIQAQMDSGTYKEVGE